MRHLLLLTLTFLAMALAPRPAQADEAPPDSLTVFGTTYCFSRADADAVCDVGVGDSSNVKRVFGMTVCTGMVPSGIHCHIGPFVSDTATASRPAGDTGFAFSLWGKTLCVGDVPAHTKCDLAVNDQRTAGVDRTTAPPHRM